MIIDIHGHYTTVPAPLVAYRGLQISFLANPTKGVVKISDDEIRESLEDGQLKKQRERGRSMVRGDCSPISTWRRTGS